MPFIGQQPLTGAYSKLDSITTSATATYNLQLGGSAYSPASANHLLVSLNGVMQAPQDSFIVSGSTITFASALTSSDSIDFIMAMGDVLNIGTPSAGTVGTSQLANDAVTGAKIENNPTIAGNLTVSGTTTATGLITASGGIAIGGTDSAHTLDDYEEGFHDATFAMNGSGSVTMSRSKIGYTKIGRMVTCTGEVTVGSTSSPVGSMTMSLPFVIANQLSNQRDAFFGFAPTAYHVPFSGGIPPKGIGNGQVSSVTFVYEQHDAAFASYVPYANDTFNFSFSYFTN